MQQEFARQREYLERTVASLRKKQIKDQKIHRNDNMRIMQETVMLITEINHLRKDASNVKNFERKAESNLCANRPVSNAGKKSVIQNTSVAALSPQAPSESKAETG